MTLPEVYRLFEYWKRNPPEHELVAMMARVYTTWRPEVDGPQSEAEHRASLEARWKAGAMNVKQIYEAMGGVLKMGGGSSNPIPPDKFPGIGPFPGTRH